MGLLRRLVSSWRFGRSWRSGRAQENANGLIGEAVGLLRRLVPRGLGGPGGFGGPRRMLTDLLERQWAY